VLCNSSGRVGGRRGRVSMSKEGWAYLLNAKNEHYFVDGRSLCRKWLGLSLDYDRTMGQPECKACRKALDKREAKNEQH
jgi:hypothetical protein